MRGLAAMASAGGTELGLGRREAKWVSRIVGVPLEDVITSMEASKPICQKASVCLPLKIRSSTGELKLYLKKGNSLHLDSKRRQRTGKSMASEYEFYTKALPSLGGVGSRLLQPLALGAYLQHSQSSSLNKTFRETQAWAEECGIEGELLLLLEDARYAASPRLLAQVAASPGGMSAGAADAAVRWLAGFHEAFRASEDLGDLDVWGQGGYWSYAKRVEILPPGEGTNRKLAFDRTHPKIEMEWNDLLDRLGDSAPGLRGLAVHGVPFPRALRESASSLSRMLARACLPGHPSRTLIHGDFKAANVFVSGNEGGGSSLATAVDYQWVGFGLGAVDLVYFLTTSLEESALEEMDSLMQVYFEAVGGDLRGFHFQADLALADYTRYLVADMWTKVSPESMEASRLEPNVGMHKRSLKCLEAVAERCTKSLESLYVSSFPLGYDWTYKPQRPLKVLGGDASTLQVRREFARLFSVLTQLAVMAGAKVAEIAEAKGDDIDVANKSEDGSTWDPQTLADVETERMIVSVLSKLFPDVCLVGEEGIVPDGSEGDEKFEKEVEDACRELSYSADCNIAPWEVQLPSSVDSESISLKDVTIWIDPLDGTKEFLQGNKNGVTTLIGCCIRGTPWFGVIHVPFSSTGRTVFGGPGLGGNYDFDKSGVMAVARPLPPPRPSQGVAKRIATTRSNPSKELEEALAKLGPIETLKVGGAGSKVLMVLDGAADAYIFPFGNATKRWDTAAGEALLLGAGGALVKASDGSSYSYEATVDPWNTEGLVATIHELGLVSSSFGWPQLGKQ
ncbi:inositol monophosphatase [Chloropicon primus]|nr:inositol monophosphatase [Chloropicon primus]